MNVFDTFFFQMLNSASYVPLQLLKSVANSYTASSTNDSHGYYYVPLATVTLTKLIVYPKANTGNNNVNTIVADIFVTQNKFADMTVLGAKTEQYVPGPDYSIRGISIDDTISELVIKLPDVVVHAGDYVSIFIYEEPLSFHEKSQISFWVDSLNSQASYVYSLDSIVTLTSKQCCGKLFGIT